jgi:hypothetical protein
VRNPNGEKKKEFRRAYPSPPPIDVHGYKSVILKHHTYDE